MSSLLSVLWTIKPATAPRPLLLCSGCGKKRSFENSGKFRLNANGKRLDAWLLYRCSGCAATWKRPIVERQSVQTFTPAFLEALQSNDRTLAEAFAFDTDALSRFASRIEVPEDAEVRKTLRSGDTSLCSLLEIFLRLPYPLALRTDRLLARELGLSRERIKKLEKAGRLTAEQQLRQQLRQKLRRPVTDGLRVAFDLSGESDRLRIAETARGDAMEGTGDDRERHCSPPPVSSDHDLRTDNQDGSP